MQNFAVPWFFSPHCVQNITAGAAGATAEGYGLAIGVS